VLQNRPEFSGLADFQTPAGAIHDKELDMRIFRRPPLASAPLRAGAVVVLLLACTAVQAQQLLDQIPNDALVVMKVKNLGVTSGKLGKFFTDLGIANMVPGMNDPLGFMQKQLNLSQGLNKDGDFGFVYRDSDALGEAPDKSIVLLIPVSDYKAFLANFGAAKTDGEVSEVTMPKGGEPGYVAKWGNYAALSPSKALVGKAPSGAAMKIPGASSSKEFGARDMVVYANFDRLRAKALPQLQQHRDEILAKVEQGVTRDEKTAKYAPVFKALVSQFLNVAEGFLRDANGATFSINFGNEGINLAVMAEFNKGSYGGNLVSGAKNTNEPLLGGLPTGKYLFFGGSANGNPEMTAKALDDFTAPILKEVLALGPEMKPAQDYVDALRQYIKATQKTSFGVVEPTGQLGQDPLIQFVTVATGDAAAMKTAQQKMATTQEQMMKAFGMPADAYKMNLTPAAKTVDGVAFDQVSTTMNANANDPMAQQQQQVMAFMYGPQGMNMYQGVVNNNMLTTSGVPESVMSAAIAAVKSNDAPLAKLAGVKSVAANLPQSRTGEAYIPVDEIVTTGLNYAKQFGAGVNLQLPPDLPPIGVTGSTEGTAFRVDAYVPSTLVQSLVAAGMQAYLQMQGGGQGGGGGGL
jgi:hypothetical protein